MEKEKHLRNKIETKNHQQEEKSLHKNGKSINEIWKNNNTFLVIVFYTELMGCHSIPMVLYARFMVITDFFVI